MTDSVKPDQLTSQKPTDLDQHCLQMQDIFELIRTLPNRDSNNAVSVYDTDLYFLAKWLSF